MIRAIWRAWAAWCHPEATHLRHSTSYALRQLLSGPRVWETAEQFTRRAR